MVGVASEPLLAARETLEMSFRILGFTRLECGLENVGLATDLIDLGASINLTIRVGGEVDDAHVDTEGADGLYLLGLGHVDDGAQVELTVHIDEVGLAAHAVETTLVIGVEDNWNFQAAIERQDGDAVDALPGKDALVVDDGTVGLEPRSDLAVESERITDLRYGTDGQLSGEAETFSNIVLNFCA